MINIELIQKRLFEHLQSFEKIEDDVRCCPVPLAMFKNLAAMADERTLLLGQQDLEQLFVQASRAILTIVSVVETEKGKKTQSFLEKFVVNDVEDEEHPRITHITYYFT